MKTTRQSPPVKTSPPPVHRHVVQPEVNTTESTPMSQILLEYSNYGLLWIMEALVHLGSYLVTPGVVLTHVVTCVLFYSLTRQGTEVRDVVRAGILHELVTYILWLCVPNTLGTVIALYFTIYLYETLYGPKVIVRENAQLVTDDDVESTIQETGPAVKYECIQEGSTYRINTLLQYVAYCRVRGQAQDAANLYAQGIPLSDISTVHDGYDYDISRVIRSLGAEKRRCFHVTLEDEKTTVTFVSRDVETRDQWLSIIRQLCCTTIGDVKSIWFDKSCKQANIALQNGPIQLDQVERILTAAQRLTDKCYLVELIKVAYRSTNTTGKKASSVAKSLSKQGSNETLVDAQILDTVFDAATFIPEIERIFLKILQKEKSNKVLETSGFCEFLNDEQKEPDVDLNAARILIKEYETVLQASKFTTIGFTNYMMSERNSIFHYKYRDVYQDMAQPLSHYFISTSHNTYLTKDQLKSKSSVEMYSNALKKGCRCVELDTWDGPNNEPIIYHGHTLTSKILFKDVITAVNQHAFTASQYPVILSFENHCSVEQQKVIASHLINILGDKLYTKQIPDDEKQYPSPHDLKGYVVVKYKKLKADQDLAYDEDSSDDDSDDEEEPNVQLDDDNEDDDEGDDEKKKGSVKSIMDVWKGIKGKKGDKKKEEIPKIAQELSDLVIYCQSVKFKGFDYSREKNQYFEMSSIGEKKALKLMKEEPLAFVQYNTKQICRTYPAGNRLDSSNYDPHNFWNIGTQMVALNFQTHDRPMQLYQGLYQDNGGCGYVLKPDCMRKAYLESGFDPRGPFATCRTLNIQVISGRQLPYSSEKNVRSDRGLSVLIRVSGVDADCAKDKTKTVKNNGFQVIWSETLKFKVHVPELALVQFTVREGNDTFLGQYTLPLRCIQQGHRNVPLWTKASVPIRHASLFVLVDLEEPKPATKPVQ